jgi:hypothetical protein
MAKFSKSGRLYDRGKSLSIDLRRNIIQDIVEQGGDFGTGYFPGNISKVALKYKVKYDTIQKGMETIL